MRVLSVDLYSSSIPSFISSLLKDCDRERINKLVNGTGSHGIITALKDKEFREILNPNYINLPSVCLIKYLGKLKV